MEYYISSGQVISGISLNSNDAMYVSSGGKLTGTLEIASGAIVSAYEGSIIDFDISGITPSSDVLVSNFSGITGTPSFSLTVSSVQVSGQYALASGVNSFDNVITVRSAMEENLGTISVGSELADFRERDDVPRGACRCLW